MAERTNPTRVSREHKRFLKEKQEKKYRRMIKEYWDLLDAQGNLGWIELDAPRKNGYQKYYVLQDHAKNSNIKNRLQKLLDKFTGTVYCHNRDFKYTRNSFFGDHKKGDPILVNNIYFRVSNQSVYDGTALEQFDADLRKYLFIEAKYTYRNDVYYEVTIYPPYIKQYFREKVGTNWITRVREIDTVLESKIDKLNDYLWINHIWSKVQSQHRSGWNRADRERYVRMKYELADDLQEE